MVNTDKAAATKGPLICASQWTMEQTIGNLVGEIRQPSNPYANLAQRAIRRAQHNSLMVMIPTLDPDYGQPLFPRWSKNLGNGYALLKLQERSRHATTFAEGLTIKTFLDAHYPHSPEYAFFDPHCLFTKRNSSKCLTCPQCKALYAGALYFAEVLFFFEIRTHTDVHALEPLALRHILFLHASWEVGLRVVRVPSIQSVVAMVPHTLAGEERFYMFEKPGMDLANLGGILWDEDDVDDEDNQPT
ncbi:hypothetical protein BD769DRAFT_1664272 [Suillus cothurnatus]|nr:hypothetical protein BD769DRAFT_1664272 [Suillus cothurnatus]